MGRSKKSEADVLKHTAFRCKQHDIDRVVKFAAKEKTAYAVALRNLVRAGLSVCLPELNEEIRRTSSLAEMELHARAGGHVWMDDSLCRLHNGKWQFHNVDGGSLKWINFNTSLFRFPVVLLPRKWYEEPPKEFLW